MLSALLIIIVYGIIILELFFDDKLIAVRYLHFSYLALFVTSAILFLYLATKKSKKMWWFAPAFLWVSLNYLLPFLSISENAKPQSTANTTVENEAQFKFLSYSVNSRNKDYHQVAGLLTQHPADIICLQEIPYSRYELFKAQISDAGLNYHHVYSKKRALMILSKHPIIPNKTMPYLEATIELAGNPVKIWNIHSPKSLTKVNYQHYYFDKLYEDVSSDTTPHKLVCGDFNSTPHNNILPLFMTMLQPAYKKSHNPISLTYPTLKGVIPSPIPLIKIDYLLFSKNFNINNYQRLAQYANSDHYPITATASITTETKTTTINSNKKTTMRTASSSSEIMQ
ncbi:MAG: endonuclease/exonuclease/phosphatase family protein [Thiotrichaceae bacterium]